MEKKNQPAGFPAPSNDMLDFIQLAARHGFMTSDPVGLDEASIENGAKLCFELGVDIDPVYFLGLARQIEREGKFNISLMMIKLDPVGSFKPGEEAPTILLEHFTDGALNEETLLTLYGEEQMPGAEAAGALEIRRIPKKYDH